MSSRKLKGDRVRFWQRRYFDSSVHGEKARSQVIRYIHRNPVKRGLVASPSSTNGAALTTTPPAFEA
jgi:putative transposase